MDDLLNKLRPRLSASALESITKIIEADEEMGDGKDAIALQIVMSVYNAAPANAPILGMEFGEILGEMREAGQSFAMPRDIAEAERIIFVVQQDCARVAHHLAQPVPEVDPDAAAKRLAWLHYTVTENTSGLTTGNRRYPRNEAELWADMPESNRNGWRAVAAAAEKGNGNG